MVVSRFWKLLSGVLQHCYNASVATVALFLFGFKMRAHIGSELRCVPHLQLCTFRPSAAHLHLHTLVSAYLHLHLRNLTQFLTQYLFQKIHQPFNTCTLSIFYLELLNNHLFRSRANRRLVSFSFCFGLVWLGLIWFGLDVCFCFVGWLDGWMLGCLVFWLFGWLVGWLVRWLALSCLVLFCFCFVLFYFVLFHLLPFGAR